MGPERRQLRERRLQKWQQRRRRSGNPRDKDALPRSHRTGDGRGGSGGAESASAAGRFGGGLEVRPRLINQAANGKENDEPAVHQTIQRAVENVRLHSQEAAQQQQQSFERTWPGEEAPEQDRTRPSRRPLPVRGEGEEAVPEKGREEGAIVVATPGGSDGDSRRSTPVSVSRRRHRLRRRSVRHPGIGPPRRSEPPRVDEEELIGREAVARGPSQGDRRPASSCAG